jgi:LEA14-like dessication related protein
MAVRNPNAFPLEVATLDYALAINDKAVAAGALPRGVALAANATTVVDADLRIDFAAFRTAMDGIVRRSTVRYELTGTAVLRDGTRLPFKRGGEIDPLKIRGLRI